MSKLFKVARVAEQSLEYKYTAQLDQKHNIFNGHFPETPVVPGVCTIDMIKDCCKDLLKRPIRFIKIKECKFLAAILPHLHTEIEVNIKLKETECCEVIAEVCFESQKMLKLKAVIE